METATGTRTTTCQCLWPEGAAAASTRDGTLRYPVETPMNNLYLSLLDRVGVRTETLGDGTGTLEHLSEI